MKSRWFKIILICVFLFQNTTLLGYTLTEWSEKCFKELPENTSSYKTFLKSNELERVLINLKDTFFAKNFSEKNEAKWVKKEGENAGLPKDKSECPHVQKKIIPTDSKVCFMGDIHGSLHSLLRNLWALVSLGFLENNFKIVKPNFYMVFTGDYVDRGHYGAEVCFTLALLKLAKWKNVILISGNHEKKEMWNEHGFALELESKFGKNKFIDLFSTIFSYFPSALFLGSGTQGNENFVQCCHGGICTNYQTKDLFKDQNAFFEKISSKQMKHFTQNDFTYKKTASPSGTERIAYCKTAVQKYLETNNLRAIFRGHQHSSFGLKILPLKTEWLDDARTESELFYWKDVVTKTETENNEFFINNYFPVFTFSTAADSKEIFLPFDCFGIITTTQNFQTWKLNIYETFLHPYLKELGRKRPRFKS